jgi:hypothetical protein
VRHLPGSRRRRLAAGLVFAAAVAAGLAAAWAGGLLFTDAARPASVESALQLFRASDPRPQALDGVYTYATRGKESLDVLGGTHHVYPATTTITVVAVPCGMRLRWDALAGRSTTWTLCTAAPGPNLRRIDEVHSFFGRHDRTLYVCAPPTNGNTGRFTCRSPHDLQTGREVGAAPARLDVGGQPVQALHYRTVGTVTGADRGTETTEWWLDSRGGLPLEVVVSNRTSRPEPLIGRAHYREDVTLHLVSTTPLR